MARPQSHVPLRQSSDYHDDDAPYSPQYRDSQQQPARGPSQQSRYSHHQTSPSYDQHQHRRPDIGSSRYSQQQQSQKGISRYRDEEEEEDYGRDEPGGWDVFADFNNTGPRISKAPLVSTPAIEGDRRASRLDPGGDRSSKSYRPISSQSHLPGVYGGGTLINPTPPGPGHTSYMGPPKSVADASSLYGGKPMSAAQMETSELVSVPVLGAEWKKSELHQLSRSGRKEERRDRRKRRWHKFSRDEQRTGCYGWSLRQLIVWGLFIACITIGLVLFFVIPRVPSFAVNSTEPFSLPQGATNTSDLIVFSRTPANFTFPALLSLQADTGSTFIPVHLNDISTTLYDLETNKKIGTGHWSGTLAAKKEIPISLPVTFSYSGINSSDVTWLNWYDACAPIYQGTTRPTRAVRIMLETSAQGLLTKSRTSTQISNIICPYERPSNSA